MTTSMPRTNRPAYYTIRQAAWVLGVEPAHISRAIRVGSLRAVRRRSRLMIPAYELARQLAGGDSG